MLNLKYLTYIFILALSVFLISCEKDDSSIIDPVLKYPVIDSVSIAPDSVNSSSIDVIAIAYVRSEDPIKNVYIKAKDPAGIEFGEYILKDDGVAPDLVANDGQYTANVIYGMSCRFVGDFTLTFIAETEFGLSGTQINKTLPVVNLENQPPVLSDLIIIPDSIQFGQSEFLIFQVSVFDPDGQCDIKNVYYDGTNPNGGQLTRQFLFDDGSCCNIGNTGVTSGDSTALDGKFTRKFFGQPGILGYYKYHLIAEDNSGAFSNILSDSIYIYP